MSDEQDIPPWESDKPRFSATLKGGKGYEAPWINISANSAGEFSRAMIAFFGWDAEECAELKPAQLTFNAVQEWAAMNNIGSAFPESSAVPHGSRSNAAQAYKAAKEEAPPPDPKADMLKKIEEQADVVSLKKLYAENKAAFDGDTDLLAAYKAKGRALSK